MVIFAALMRGAWGASGGPSVVCIARCEGSGGSGGIRGMGVNFHDVQSVSFALNNAKED